MDEVTLTLSRPVEIMVNGEYVETQSVYMKAPTGQVRLEAAAINTAFSQAATKLNAMNAMNAIGAAPNLAIGDTMIDLDGPTMCGILEAGGNATAVYKLLEEIYKKAFVTMEGQPITAAVLERMVFRDIMTIHEAYIANFMQPSWGRRTG